MDEMRMMGKSTKTERKKREKPQMIEERRGSLPNPDKPKQTNVII
jgi:hypothetical protein